MPDMKPLADRSYTPSPYIMMLDISAKLRHIDKLGHDLHAAEEILEAMLEQLRPVLERQPDGVAHHIQGAAVRGHELVVVTLEDDGSITARTEPIQSLVGVEWPEAPVVGAGADAEDALDGLDQALAAESGSAVYQSVNPRVTLVFPEPCEDTQ